MVEHLTSYDATSGGNVINEDVYGSTIHLAGLANEYQEHKHTKDAPLRPKLYAIDFHHLGLHTSVRYPNGRKVFFDYSSSPRRA